MSALADVMPGTATFAWVELPGTVGNDGLVGREIVLERLGSVVMATYFAPDGSSQEFPLTGRTAEDDDELRTVVTEHGHVVAFAHATEEEAPRRRWLHLRVYEIVGSFDWGELRVGADEAALDSAKRIAGSKEVRGWGPALGWLQSKLLFSEPPGRQSPLDMPGGLAQSGGPRRRRLLAIVRPGSDISAPLSCRLVGDGIVATLVQVQGEWRLRQVHREARSLRDHERVALIHARVEIFEATVRAGLKLMMREELSRLGSDEAERTFMAIWRRYHEMENRYALRRMTELGLLEYTAWSYQDDAEDVIRFEIAGGRDGLLTRIREETEAGNGPELECTVQPPEILGGSGRIDEDSGLLGLELEAGNETGEVIYANDELRVVHMRMVRRGGDEAGLVTPPRQGFIHSAVRGDYRRLERRNRALKRLLNGRVPLPQLLPLLQGTPARGKARRPIKPRSRAADARFGPDGPNEEQTLALDRALNTPDIAVIQGPPGTGKTQFITALQVRLAEEGRKHAVVSHSMLLTSYQHAAVDNLVERSKVWDLPSVKIDSQNRGSTAEIENWRTATARALREEYRDTPDGRRTMAMRRVARLTADYCRIPMPAEELVRRLDDVADQVSGLVSDDLLSRVRTIATELRGTTRVAGLRADHRRESALRAVRGIRCLPVSFEDDGPEMAESALHQLDRLPVADEAHRELLGRAAGWPGDGPPPFLPELVTARDELLDRLTDRADRLFRPAAREDVVDLLNEIVDDLDARRRTTAEGVDAALMEFVEELEGDPEAVLATLRLYTTSLGTTCQQADSRAVRDVKDGERLFDTVIVDEAARANPLDLLIPLTLASRRVILVGDQNQLPHMLEPDVERELRSDAGNTLDTLRESLFARLFTLLHRDDTTAGPGRAVRLRKQYRMHPVLGEFVGRTFYDDGLESPLRDHEKFAHRLDRYGDAPAAWLRVTAGREHGGQSKARTAEAEAIAQELRRYALDRPDLTFGVISFYSAQVRLIWDELVKVGLAEPTQRGYRPTDELRRDAEGRERNRLQVGTVDAFQGKQFDVALLSITRSSPLPQQRPAPAEYEQWARRTYGHLMLSNRLCVAMSRQERLLVVVGDDDMFTSPMAPASVAPLRAFRQLCEPPHGVTLQYVPGAGR